MKQLIPGKIDIIAFVMIALICGLLVQYSANRDYMLGILTVPIFLFASLRGFRQNRMMEPVEVEAEEPEK